MKLSQQEMLKIKGGLVISHGTNLPKEFNIITNAAGDNTNQRRNCSCNGTGSNSNQATNCICTNADCVHLTL